MHRERRNDRLQGVLFDARPVVFAGPALHPKALLLSVRQFTQRFVRKATWRRGRAMPVPKQYRLSGNATDLLKRFK